MSVDDAASFRVLIRLVTSILSDGQEDAAELEEQRSHPTLESGFSDASVG